MIAVIDYGAGNLFSVCNALTFLGIKHVITSDAEEIMSAEGVILPGVGAFPEAMSRLEAAGLVEPLRRSAGEKPFLGICLGMQMLFDYGYEFAKTPGLGLIPGEVRPIEAPGLKIPHMGWNSIHIHQSTPLTMGLREGDYVYYVHSYAAVVAPEALVLSSDYGGPVTGLVARGQVYGAQFHPEKSGAAGLTILKNFGGLVK